MRKLRKLFTPVLLLFAALIFSFGLQSVYAAPSPYDPYAISLTNYDVTYDIKSDCTMHVTEYITVQYLGTRNTGLARDIPVNAGDRVRNITVSLAEDGDEAHYPHDVEFDEEFIVVKITDGNHKAYESEQTFKIDFDYEVTKPTSGTMLSINPIGFGWGCTIYDADVTLKLPDGYKNADYYIGKTDIKSDDFTYDPATHTITAHVEKLNQGNGLTFDLHFNDGILSTVFDPTPYIIAVVGCAVLIALVAVKFLVFNKNKITPVVNFTAPDEIDPLAMGKLIDNKVSGEDVTSLIYYWADKGYINIDLSDEKNPVFIRIMQRLPAGAPSYQHRMYQDMFGNSDEVTMRSLEYKFYGTVEKVKSEVNSTYKGLYTSSSIGVSVIFALLGGLLMALAPIIMAKVRISGTMFLFETLIMIVPSFVVYGLTETLVYFKFKLKKKQILLLTVLIALGAAFVTLLYAFLVPDAVMEKAPKVLICLAGFVVIMLSVTLISRTENYNKQLNQIIGFRNFILYTEKDKLEAMLADNPQLYYHVLPYAQVLGVTDVWENKFSSLTLEPPRWATNPLGTYIELSVISRTLRMTSSSMATKMVSHPSSSGMSGGGHGGGSFGGFGGGGHGGGGGRGI